MKHIALTIALLTPSICLAMPCTNTTKHCFHKEAVADTIFDSKRDCGLNLTEIRKCDEPFCRNVRMYMTSVETVKEAMQNNKLTIAKHVMEEVSPLILEFQTAGLTPEQIGKIPGSSQAECKSVLQQKRTMQLRKVGGKGPVKLLFKGQYPIQDVFTKGKPRKFDLCKIDTQIQIDRGGVSVSNSLSTALKNFANNQQIIADFINLPDSSMKTEMLNQVKTAQDVLIEDFHNIQITDEELKGIPPIREFQDHIRNNCSKEASPKK